MNGLDAKRRFLFIRFAVTFLVMAVAFLVVVGVVVGIALGPLHDSLSPPAQFLSLLCGVPLAFLLVTGALGSWVFRRIGWPVAEVMAAADAVAAGDLTVRLRENFPGQYARLARSFNRMTAELARAEQQRRNLTADVAHELRTPLHIVQGNLEGILDGVYQPTAEHLQATLEETRLLARLVNDLQTLSLAESGQLALHPTELLAADLLADVAASFSGQAAESGVALLVKVEPPGAALRLHADPDRLDQVLSNLAANALRYTPAGGSITLGAAAIPSGVRLTVSDTGEGISAEDLPFIFDRFWKGDRARTRQGQGGSGLGLAIARQLVQAHGGQIRAESQPGAGTVFTIELGEGGAG
jgi:two-component system OmpR family sensor kinase/two-component system sensor histidine kinase BaeS